MNKTNQFNIKVSYVSPDVKIATVRARRNILTGSITGGNDSLEGMNRRVTDDWNWDEEE